MKSMEMLTGFGMAAAMLLAGCRDRVEDHADRAADAVAADVGNASANVAASVDRLANTVDAHVERAGARAIDDAAAHVDRATDRFAQDLRAHTDRAADATGAALEDAGRSLRDRDARLEADEQAAAHR